MLIRCKNETFELDDPAFGDTLAPTRQTVLHRTNGPQLRTVLRNVCQFDTQLQFSDICRDTFRALKDWLKRVSGQPVYVDGELREITSVQLVPTVDSRHGKCSFILNMRLPQCEISRPLYNN